MKMKKTIMAIIALTIISVLFSMPCSAQDETNNNDWEQEFVTALQKGKVTPSDDSEALAYTPDQASILEEAIKNAMQKKAPPCEAMKIAVELNYNEFSVVKNIFGYGGEVDLNQLCGCATESGIKREIVAQAAREAVSPLGEPVFNRDEITQAQCLTGLGYTPYVTEVPRTEPRDKPTPFSVTAPGA